MAWLGVFLLLVLRIAISRSGRRQKMKTAFELSARKLLGYLTKNNIPRVDHLDPKYKYPRTDSGHSKWQLENFTNSGCFFYLTFLWMVRLTIVLYEPGNKSEFKLQLLVTHSATLLLIFTRFVFILTNKTKKIRLFLVFAKSCFVPRNPISNRDAGLEQTMISFFSQFSLFLNPIRSSPETDTHFQPFQFFIAYLFLLYHSLCDLWHTLTHSHMP